MVSRINLGWCKNSRKLGNIIHAIGHIIGMNNEQERPDATRQADGHGPFLTVFWDNLSPVKRTEFEEDAASYVGSVKDSPVDPILEGYAPYDFDSIMHYPSAWGTNFETIPKGRKTGQRKELSKSDVDQVNDIYQCVTKSGPMPAPSPPPQPQLQPQPERQPQPFAAPSPPQQAHNDVSSMSSSGNATAAKKGGAHQGRSVYVHHMFVLLSTLMVNGLWN